MKRLSIEDIAKVCHSANKAYCESIGDLSQVSWDEAPQWQRESAIRGVQFKRANPNAGDSAQHDAWATDKYADGWKWGETKDPDKKLHPCLIPYEQLPTEQRMKDALFRSIVEALGDML